ncbi:winged helix-turn-helix transcriptional regulator [Zavarzinia compransoris]|uniref:Transcriptional regulator n=1 Tax=Zavarzinia compransoris TaxID=1264899 RepID=A0A317E309_9PROT|nr:helix-turn-helix domain-containing protein [Zavarzinia compransoris]PWR20560.1 transcriptional regulator [Zavarzinia compransoris]TDP43794.1 HxlR family transcriptional regulator [Zavarzinia compransoris]
MQRTSFARMQCSLARGLDVVGDGWTLLILRDLFLGLDRFDDLVADLGISRNLLTRRLTQLIDSGIVERRAYARRPLRYAYSLSPAGLDLVPAILALTAWGERWARPAEGSPLVFVHHDCGRPFQAEVHCSACGGRVEAGAVDVLPGPGGAAKPGTMVVAGRLAERERARRQERARQEEQEGEDR